MAANTAYYMYVSTRGDWDPVKTIFVCGPSDQVSSVSGAQAFARTTGWEQLAEENKCLLIVPCAEKGWENVSPDLLKNIYNDIKMKVPAAQGKSIWGRGGLLWCWEIILFAAGYGDGAEFVGRVQIAHPNLLAAAALVGKAPEDFSAGELLSDHWFVKTVSEDYAVKNAQIPCQTWIYTADPGQAEPFVTYINGVNAVPAEAPAFWEEILGMEGRVFYGTRDGALEKSHQVRIFSLKEEEKAGSFASHILHGCFDHVVRWKNSPDGTLARVDSREEFYKSDRYLRRTAALKGNYYDYFVHIPAGKTMDQVKGLPLVISVHGRGEPAWMFTDKNGWESLADETGEFITISPDSPGNIWFWPRDSHAFTVMIDQMAEEFGIDRSRVYLTGFSNGGSITREVSAQFPELFAAISPWNGPQIDSGEMMEQDISRMPNHISPEMTDILKKLAERKTGLPAFIYYGDRDMGISVEGNLCMPYYLRTNDCPAGPSADCPACYETAEIRDCSNYYTAEAGYRHGDRFTTYVYRDRAGQEKVCVTIMKNMPHGAIREESRAAWEFMKQFRR